jgi:hypothetical protein
MTARWGRDARTLTEVLPAGVSITAALATHWTKPLSRVLVSEMKSVLLSCTCSSCKTFNDDYYDDDDDDGDNDGVDGDDYCGTGYTPDEASQSCVGE